MSDQSQLPFYKEPGQSGAPDRFYLRGGVQGADNTEISERQYEALSAFAEQSNTSVGDTASIPPDLLKLHAERADQDYKPDPEQKYEPPISGYYDGTSEEIKDLADTIPENEGATIHGSGKAEPDTEEEDTVKDEPASTDTVEEVKPAEEDKPVTKAAKKH